MNYVLIKLVRGKNFMYFKNPNNQFSVFFMFCSGYLKQSNQAHIYTLVSKKKELFNAALSNFGGYKKLEDVRKMDKKVRQID